MQFPYFDLMSLEQQAIAGQFNDVLLAEVQECICQLQRIDAIGRQGEVSLPAISASGEPMRHGANCHMINIRKYWVERLILAARGLDDARSVIPEEYWRDARA